MKKLFLIILTFSFSLTVAQEEMSPEQKAWVDFMTPNWAHEMLQKNVGEWKVQTKTWFVPGQPPEVTEGTASAKAILGGRYIQTKYTGTSMGMPMEGMSLDAYDKVRGEFVSVWIDNFGTGVATAYGKIDKDKKTITYFGSMTDPVSKGEYKYRTVVTHLSKDQYKFEMYMINGDKETQSMEMVNTRIK